MHNWSVNINQLKKNPDALARFVLEQRINYGLNGHKISLAELKKYWHLLRLDPLKKSYLEKIVWPS